VVDHIRKSVSGGSYKERALVADHMRKEHQWRIILGKMVSGGSYKKRASVADHKVKTKILVVTQVVRMSSRS
jgi:hypothetical protein